MWDFDNGQQPILFDMEVGGQPVKALAQANKNAWLYILNRETGEPVHPIIEMPVPTETTTPGEQPWPTQPIPHKADGERMEPVSPIFPINIPPEVLGDRVLVPQYTPNAPNTIRAGGGASYGPISYSPQTGLLYVNAIDRPSGRARELAGLQAADGYFSAYDPDDGRTRVATNLRRLWAGGVGRDVRWRCIRGNREQHRRVFLRFRCRNWREALAIQHRLRGLFVAFGVHGRRRAVRDGRVRWRR